MAGRQSENYTIDRSIHGRFESEFVDAIALEPQNLADRIGAPGRQRGDLFEVVLSFLDEAGSHMETVYILEKRGGFSNPEDRDARALVYSRAAAGAAMLRDMIYRAWIESAEPPAQVVPSPLDPANPLYNPATGSAPSH